MVRRKEPGTRSKTYAATFGEIKYQTTTQESWRSYIPHIVKRNFLQSHLDIFSGNMAAVSDKHSERILQDIIRLNKRQGGKCNPHMLADYCWTLVRGTPTKECRRQKKRQDGFMMLHYLFLSRILCIDTVFTF